MLSALRCSLIVFNQYHTVLFTQHRVISLVRHWEKLQQRADDTITDMEVGVINTDTLGIYSVFMAGSSIR